MHSKVVASMHKLLLLLVSSLVCTAAFAAASDAGWPAYGGTAGGGHYSPLAQITPANVDQLRVAWIFRTGELGEGVKDWDRSAFEATPILYNGVLYLTTSGSNVVAVDAASGEPRWRHDSHVFDQHRSDGVSRGVSLWVDTATAEDAVCHARIFAPTLDSRLLALDAVTGKSCEDFGDHGEVNLLEGVRSEEDPKDEWRDYLVTSPPAILDGKVIVGSSIGDNRAVELELGVVRAFDARSGRLVWSWDPIPRDSSNPVYKEWSEKGAKLTGAANAWAPLAVDEQRHLVFVPTGSASPDFFGGERPGDNRWANSIVALDGATGKLVWGYQIVHHDLWDYDLASQPTLVDLMHDGKYVPAVIQPTKTGFLYTFNRDTGQPVFPIEEKPVPQDAVPGETPSPTQPIPVAPPPLVRQGPVSPDEAWGLTFWDKGRCRDMIKNSRSEGIFQPPSLDMDSIMRPGNAGGFNWGGIAFDPEHQLAVGNSMDLPFLVDLMPTANRHAQAISGKYDDWEFARMTGTPYGMRREVMKSPLGIPCIQPPWSTLAAVDMVHGTIKWQIPLGDTPLVHMNVGVPAIGGPMITAGGLVFIGATLTDQRFRAFDINDGKLLWEVKLPAGGQATPMSYSVNGRQYVVIAAGGYKGDSKRGDYLVAYALPN